MASSGVDTSADPAGGHGHSPFSEPAPGGPGPSRGHEDAPADQSSWIGVAVLAGLLGWLTIGAGWEYLVVVSLLVFMITMHELGHYLTARWSGMKVTEFFLGFGPRLFSFRRGETEYGIKGIWAGAYVKIIGMNNLEEVDPADESRTFRQQSYPKRILVAVAGSTMHFLMAIVAIYALLVSSGLEWDETAWTVSETSVGGTAEAMDLQPGDVVVGAQGETFETFEEMRLFVEAHPSETVVFDVLRDGEVQQIEGTIGQNPDTGLGLLGVRTDPDELPRISMGAIEAVPESVQLFGTITKETVVSIGSIFSPSGLVDFFGRLDDAGDDTAAVDAGQAGEVEPVTDGQENEGRILSLVGATRLGAELTSGGFAGVLIFFLSINIFVGVINLAPLLPLDGGHVVIATYERLRSRKGKRYYADAAKALPVAYAVILLMTTVGIAALYLDIADPISL